MEAHINALLCWLQICAHPDFELLVVLIIFANCVTLSLYNPMIADREGINGTLYWFGERMGMEQTQRAIPAAEPSLL